MDYAAEGRDPDRRDYAVSYQKIRGLGFATTLSVREAVEEVIRHLGAAGRAESGVPAD